MKTFKLILFLMLALLARPADPRENWPERIEAGGTPLYLAGLGTARYLLWRVYEAALYLPPGTTPTAALDESTPRCLELRYLREVKAADIRRTADTILARQLDADTLARLRPAVETLHRAYRDVGPGDRYRLCHLPGAPLRLYFNGRLAAEVAARDLARAYFAIWLGERAPISEDLRRRLLARRGRS